MRAFRILVVCTGNICRSPIAERVMADGLRRRLGGQAEHFEVVSAGTWGHAGAPMDPFAVAALDELGLADDGFVARELDPQMVARADLVLTATREHRAAAVTLHPRAAAYTFTLTEFGRLASAVEPGDLPAGDPVARARALVGAAGARRGQVRPDRPEDDDLRDPYGAPLSAFRRTAAEIDAALRRPLDLLAAVQ